MTGVYTCFLEYKPTVDEGAANLQLKYVIYGKKCSCLYSHLSSCFQMFGYFNRFFYKGILLIGYPTMAKGTLQYN